MPRSSPSLLVVLALAAGLPLTAPSEAQACSCLPGPVLTWPGDAATDVPTNTSIVMGGHGARFADGAGNASADGGLPPLALDEVALFGPDGELVPLRLERHLESQAGCTSGDFIALPARSLEPHSEYMLQIGQSGTATFTTGDGPSSGDPAEAAASLEWQTLARSSSPSQISMMYLPRSAAVPLFVQYQGSEATLSALLYPNREQPLSFSVGGVECVEVEVVDLRGETVHVEEVCHADRCLDSDLTIGSSCGGNPSLYLGYDEFLKLPLGCGSSVAPEAPGAPGPVDEQAGGRNSVDETSDGMELVGGEPPETGREAIDDTETTEGCAVRGSSRLGSAPLVSLTLILIGMALRRRSVLRKSSH